MGRISFQREINGKRTLERVARTKASQRNARNKISIGFLGIAVVTAVIVRRTRSVARDVTETFNIQIDNDGFLAVS